MNEVETIIAKCGGAKAIAEESPKYGKKLHHTTVYKWASNGIPAWRWPMMIALSKATEAELFRANQAVVSGGVKPNGHRAPARRKGRERDEHRRRLRAR